MTCNLAASIGYAGPQFANLTTNLPSPASQTLPQGAYRFEIIITCGNRVWYISRVKLGTTENSVEPMKFQNFKWLHTSYMKLRNNAACLLCDHIPECQVLLEKCARPYFCGRL